MWRSDRDESEFLDEYYIAWEYVLPLKNIPILESEYEDVKKMALFLEKTFSKRALKTARAKMEA
jgi:hypothetical protein